MSAHSDASVAVWHYDGVSAVRRDARLIARGSSFVLEDRGDETGPWRFKDLVAHGELGGMSQFGLRKQPGWRIGLEEDPPAELAALLPRVKRYGGLIDRIGLIPAMVIFAVVSCGIGYLLLASPATLAKLVPMSAEHAFGDEVMNKLDRWRCRSPEGEAALKALTQRMGVPDGADIRIVRMPVNNAFAAPGGGMVVFSELIDSAQSPEELAGVLGHELGHVHERHWMRYQIRESGLKVVLGGFGFGSIWPTDVSVRDIAQGTILAGYSRADEAEADGYSIDLLNRAHISTRKSAAFFETLMKEEAKFSASYTMDTWSTYGGSHPASAERKARLEAADRPGTTPALDAKQWQALRSICSGVTPPKAGLYS